MLQPKTTVFKRLFSSLAWRFNHHRPTQCLAWWQRALQERLVSWFAHGGFTLAQYYFGFTEISKVPSGILVAIIDSDGIPIALNAD